VMRPSVIVGQWSRLIVGSLQTAGVRVVLASPGSRSTPLLWAMQDAAEAGANRLTLRMVLDERTAGYEAVARSKVTGEPTALLCTSGTAVANYHPAVIEAYGSQTPLVVLTADRPPELQDCSAPQTIDQVKLFGVHAHWVDLGLPETGTETLRAVRRAVLAGVAHARSQRCPVQFEVRLRKPLEPEIPQSPEEMALAATVDCLLSEAASRSERSEVRAPRRQLDSLRAAVAEAPAVAVVAGPLAPSRSPSSTLVQEVLRPLGACLWAESTSQLRHLACAPLTGHLCDFFPLWLDHAQLPDATVLVEVGGPPTTSSYERLLARQPSLRRFVLAEQGWPDPFSSAEQVIVGDVSASLATLQGATTTEEAAEFLRSALDCNRRLGAAVDSVLGPAAPWGEGVAVAAVMAALPSGAALALGNSLPLREVDIMAPASSKDLMVACQRGANGIDGSISLVLGTALASGRPTVGLLGDLSVLHDLSALASAADLAVPVALVMLNNGGGRIFEQLPVRTLADTKPPRISGWVMPHRLSLSVAGQLFGLAHCCVGGVEPLQAAVAVSLSRPGVTLIEVMVPPGSARLQGEALVTAARRALARRP
jgi:2-succinyl-5-enolpyruvyl-6-hydroxy-3-cyclohexene-1-carboxylate synthase